MVQYARRPGIRTAVAATIVTFALGHIQAPQPISSAIRPASRVEWPALTDTLAELLNTGDAVSPQLLDALANGLDPNETAAPPVPENAIVAFVEAPDGPLGIVGPVLDAYLRAAHTLAATMPHCGLHWSYLAGIGKVESNHAGGRVDVHGNTAAPILGPVLNGGPGMAAIRDTDGGRFDGDATWDRAVGPMQFLPGTWARYGADGNGDGVANPHNVYDAALATGRYLCSGGLNLREPDQLVTAVFRYNHSAEYVRRVLGLAAGYAPGVIRLPALPVVPVVMPVPVPGPPLAAPAVPGEPAVPVPAPQPASDPAQSTSDPTQTPVDQCANGVSANPLPDPAPGEVPENAPCPSASSSSPAPEPPSVTPEPSEPPSPAPAEPPSAPSTTTSETTDPPTQESP